jgi:hypothetical protein
MTPQSIILDGFYKHNPQMAEERKKLEAYEKLGGWQLQELMGVKPLTEQFDKHVLRSLLGYSYQHPCHRKVRA